jgi:hypothetical protein
MKPRGANVIEIRFQREALKSMSSVTKRLDF